MTIPLLRGDILKQIRTEPHPVVIEFFAVWCPKCSMMSPVYERVARRLSKKASFYKVDIDISEDAANELGIEIVPTFVVFYRGQVLGYTSGVIAQSILENRIQQMINF